MTRLSTSLAALALLSSTATAETPQVFNWTGFYIGAHNGYLWGDSQITIDVGGGGPGSSASANPEPEGALVGGDIGFLYHLPGGLVGGVEGDFSIPFKADDTARFDPAGFGGGLIGSFGIDWTAAVRGRLGFAIDRLFLSVTGGVAAAGVNGQSSTLGGMVLPLTPIDEDLIGWTVGGGVAFAVSHHFSLNADYRYSDYGGRSVSIGGLASQDYELRTQEIIVGGKVRLGP